MYETHPDVISHMHYLESLPEAEQEILHLYVKNQVPSTARNNKRRSGNSR